MKKIFFVLLFPILLFAREPNVPLLVVASTSDLAAIAREVGGDGVVVETICKPTQDPHAFELLPAQVMTVKKADVYLKVGLSLDRWVDDLVRGAGNSDLIVTDCSAGIPVISSSDDEQHAHGGVHPQGNPHYWLSPKNSRQIAQNILSSFVRKDSARAESFRGNYDRFSARLDSAMILWQEKLAPCRGAALVSMHPEWDYFARDFELSILGVVSTIPDGEPSPQHFAELEKAIRLQKKVIFLREPFVSSRMSDVLVRDTGIPVMIAPSSVGGIPESTDYWSHFHYLANRLAEICSRSR